MMSTTMTTTHSFHVKTAYEMATAIKALIDSCPVTVFSELETGKQYHYKNGSGETVVSVERMLPSRKMADVLFYGEAQPRRITPTRYYGTFRELSDEVKPWLGVTHEAVIDAAITEGREVPARVRVHYPDKFVELPERFSVQQLRDTIRPQWGKVVTATVVDEMIEQRHQQIRKVDEQLPKVVALSPDHVKDYERYIANWTTDLDFYRWLRPLVDTGGVFDLNGEKP